jgi:hypothetical protein
MGDYREEAESVSELTLEDASREDAHTYRDAKLGTQGQRIKKSIHNFAEAYVFSLICASVVNMIFVGGGLTFLTSTFHWPDLVLPGNLPLQIRKQDHQVSPVPTQIPAVRHQLPIRHHSQVLQSRLPLVLRGNIVHHHYFHVGEALQAILRQ